MTGFETDRVVELLVATLKARELMRPSVKSGLTLQQYSQMAGAPELRARETENQQSKRLEVQDGRRLVTGATAAASSGDTGIATVGTIDGAKVGRG